MLGSAGHLCIIISFVASLLCIFSYVKAGLLLPSPNRHWLKNARICFKIHFVSILAAFTCLFLILKNHHYEYQYAWQHSSNELPWYFLLSCFWEGQEGSFLVWIAWNAFIGLVLMLRARIMETRVMTVFMGLQVLLITMIMGSYIGNTWQLGSSPFMLLNETSANSLFESNPNFIPANGSGLNPLLQNIWMVIHPPIIFLGFALCSVPFSFCIAGLIKQNPMGWIKQAQKWLLLCTGILGLGIMMGAYWAYETLNFGGYWNWDPVENAVYIPWLVLVAAVHATLLFRKRKKALLLTNILVISAFILVIYSTFLTRSGILGDSSVHAFTDNGLSNQILFLLFFTLCVSIGLLIYNRKKISGNKQSPLKSIDLSFWVASGITILCLAAFQVLLPTSFPVINKISALMGATEKIATPSDQVIFYSKFQLWFAVGIGITAGIAQIIYFKGIQNWKNFEQHLFKPVLFALLAASLLVFYLRIQDLRYIVLLISAFFAFAVAATMLYKPLKSKDIKWGGSLSHLGFSVMIIGFVLSSGKSKILSQNRSLNAPESNLPVHTVQENMLLNRDIGVKMQNYNFVFEGVYLESVDKKFKYNIDLLSPTSHEDKYIAKADLTADNVVGKQGNIVTVNKENRFYHLLVIKGNDTLHLWPRMQNNPKMGYIASPSIASFLNKDLYVHVSNFPDPSKVKWSPPEHFSINKGLSFNYKGLIVTLDKIEQGLEFAHLNPEEADFALTAQLTINDKERSYKCKPTFAIKGDRVRIYPDKVSALGVQVGFNNIDPKTGEVKLDISSSQRDWITLKVLEMPFISFVWIGTLIMCLGITQSIRDKILNGAGKVIALHSSDHNEEQKVPANQH